MDSSFEKLQNTFNQASADLGFEIISPFILESGSKRYQFLVLVKYFGNSNGTLLAKLEENQLIEVAKKSNYYCSLINPEGFAKYSRKYFIDMLNDWQYFGLESQKPDWYTGESW